MVLATSNKCQKLLSLRYVDRVTPEELEGLLQEIEYLIAELPSDIRMLADLSQLEYMDPACMTVIGKTMDLLDKHGVSVIVRVIPDDSKDIGLNILSIFHYAHHPRLITCQTLPQALRQLSFWK